jgi:predicted deacylase
MRSRLAMLLALAFAAPASAQKGDLHATVTVGSAVAKRGERVYGAITVPPGVDSGTNMPVAVINGAKPGPVLALVAGSHGTEYASIVALTRIIAHLDPKTISGTVIVAPLLNIASFEEMRVHLNPTDKKSMNGNYPGDQAGTQTQRALALVADQIVKQADVVVDLHGGDLDEDLRPYSYWVRSGNADLDARGKELALAFGLGDIILLDLDVSQAAGRRNLSGYTLSQGKVNIVAEAGRVGVSSPEDVGALIDGCLNVMGALKMIDRTVKPVEHPVWIANDVRVPADGPMMFYQTVNRGDYVLKGSVIGHTTDFLGRPGADVLAPIDGIVTFVRGVPSVWKGAALVVVGAVYADPPPYQKPAP